VLSEIDEIIRQILDGYAGEPWHGYSTREIMEGITASQAFAHPIPGAHSIAEIVLHMISWQNEVINRVQGQAPGLPSEGDWPTIGPGGEPEWRSCRARLQESTDQLVATVRSAPADLLDRRVGSSADRSLATGMTMRATLHGVVSHNAYHSGQIALLKKHTP
jgi:uncharacterized damage-inducible protein DinB